MGNKTPTVEPEPDYPTTDTTTTEGPVRGYIKNNIHTFKGIPYAAPLTALSRWQAPIPALQRDDIFDATKWGEIAPQAVQTMPSFLLTKGGAAFINMSAKEMKERRWGPNCLNLNIWSESIETEERRPVIVLIHGGGLSMGCSSLNAMDGGALAGKGVVYVSLNYRVGIQGFLAGDGLFEDGILCANRGMLDVIMAVRWVKENIQWFGGDGENITLCGQSGGGTLVWSILASPLSEGLVQRAVILSGPINLTSIDDQVALGKDVLAKIGVTPGDVNSLMNVSDSDAISLHMQTLLFQKAEKYGEMGKTKLPTTCAYGTDSIPENIFEAIQLGRFNHIDLFVGSCANDGRASYVALPLPSTMGITFMNKMIAGMIAPTKEERTVIRTKYKEIMPNESKLIREEQLQTDALYRMRALHAAELHSNISEARTYVYQFNWESPVKELAAIHGLELTFFLDNLQYSTSISGDGEDAVILAETISNAFVAFATNGHPDTESLEWPQYEEEERLTMIFDNNPECLSDPYKELREVWDF